MRCATDAYGITATFALNNRAMAGWEWAKVGGERGSNAGGRLCWRAQEERAQKDAGQHGWLGGGAGGLPGALCLG